MRSGVEIHSNSYVLLETHALLAARAGRDAALQFDAAFLPLLRIAWIDAVSHDRSVRRMRSAPRGVSLVDCSAFVIMDDLGIEEAFAFDPHFQDAGYRSVRLEP